MERFPQRFYFRVRALPIQWTRLSPSLEQALVTEHRDLRKFLWHVLVNCYTILHKYLLSTDGARLLYHKKQRYIFY